MAAPATAPASPAKPCVHSSLYACLAECCMYTCDISCAITPANWDSLAAAVTVPMLTNICPPGRAKALISFCATTWNSYGQVCSAGMVATTSCPVAGCTAFPDCCRAIPAFADTPAPRPAFPALAAGRATCEHCPDSETPHWQIAGRPALPATTQSATAPVLRGRPLDLR